MKIKDKNEKVLMIGFALIILVALLTIFRGKIATLGSNLNTPKPQASSSNKISYDTISAPDLQKKIAVKEDLVLLDIRPFEDYSNEHILDVVNISLAEMPINGKIDSKRNIFIIGASSSDKDVEKAVSELKKEGFANLKVLAGGMESWNNLIGATVKYGDPNSFVDQSKVSYVEADKIKEALDQKVPMFILDVRSSEEFASGHLVGAKNIPFEELEKRHSEIATVPKIVIAGINELQEFQAGVQIYDMNLTAVFVLKGGMPGWQQKNFELVK